jgi:hypothetical protein
MKELRETLANEVPDTALDAEVGRIVKAANKPKAKRVRHRGMPDNA